MTAKPIRVLIVDDSAIVRKLLTDALTADSGIEVVGTAPDPYVARDKIVSLEPDVLTLDIEMPRMDGLTFLRKLMQQYPLPVIVISSLGVAGCKTTLDALEAGAVEVLCKPGGPYSVGDFRHDLPRKIRAAAAAHIRKAPQAAPAPVPASAGTAPRIAPTHTAAASSAASVPLVSMASYRPGTVVAIGASTGGTEAIRAVLEQIPASFPPIVVVQHIPANFSRAFAERLNKSCQIEVREAADGDLLRPGLALIAPGNFHMEVKQGAGGMAVHLHSGPQVWFQRPAVDLLFNSLARINGNKTVAALLTGMGSDGAAGMVALKRAGSHTIAQDESTCVVFGMPREAIRAGAAIDVLPLPRIAAAIAAASSNAAKPRTA